MSRGNVHWKIIEEINRDVRYNQAKGIIMGRKTALLACMIVAILLTGCMMDPYANTNQNTNPTPANNTPQTPQWTPQEYTWSDVPYGEGYKQFTGGQKVFYKDLYDRCTLFFEGGDITSRDVTVTMEYFKPSDYGLTVEDMSEVWSVFTTENPRFYWLAHVMKIIEVQGEGTEITLEIPEEYRSVEARAAMDAKFYAYLDGCQKLIVEKNATSDLEKALIIHDYILENMEYAYENDGVTPVDAEWAHSIVGAIDRKKGVCEAYAKAFHLLCEINGVEEIIVIGNASNDGGVNSFGHAWNLIRINGAWYGVDVTWDDNETDTHIYFGIDNQFLSYEHAPNTPSNEGINFYYTVPEASASRMAMVYLYRDSQYVGLYESPDAALAAMTSSTSNYEIRLFEYSPYSIPVYISPGVSESIPIAQFHVKGTQSPQVKGIAFTGFIIEIEGNQYVHRLYFDNAYKLNCNITFKNLSVQDNGFNGGGRYSAKTL